jgi:FixJ family two-component response regulator
VTDNNTTIWVVDDDPSVCNALKRLLKSVGLSVKTYASAQAFLDDGHIKDAGLLILDVRMPGLSGLELQKQLAASGSEIPIIFITAHDNGDIYTKAIEEGAKAFLHKPFDEQDLLDAIYAVIE